MLSKSDKTRQFIIEKAAPLFNTKGYAATSMNDILKATGLAKGGVYGNFNSKDEIAAEAFDYAYTQLKQALIAKIKPYNTASEQLLAILKFYKNYTITPIVQGGCPLLNTATEADDQLPFLKQKAAFALKEMLGSLEYLIQKGIDKGEFKTTLNPSQEAVLFFSIIEGGVMMGKLSDDPKMLNNLLDHLSDQINTRYKL